MFSRRRLKLSIKLIITFCFIFLVLLIVPKALARYQSISSSNANVDIAFYVISSSMQTENLVMNDLHPEFAGMNIYDARTKIVERLQEIGALIKIEDYTHNVAKCDRCHSTIEPRISDQWFVKIFVILYRRQEVQFFALPQALRVLHIHLTTY